MDQSKPKRKRGRPRKNAEKVEHKPDKKEKKEENIVLYLALDDDDNNENTNTNTNINDNKNDNDNDNNNDNNNNKETVIVSDQADANTKKSGKYEKDDQNDSGDDNRFTTNDSEIKHKRYDAVDSVTDSDTDTDEPDDNLNVSNKQLTVKILIEEVKKRDTIIAKLRSKGGSVLSSYNSAKQPNVNYHCTQMADAKSGKKFTPTHTDIHCWWCDEQFDNLPAYIVNYYRNGIYYIFGIFCSFNCSLKYNKKMLKDYKCDTRQALTNSLRIKVTGDSKPIKYAADRELLKSKGGTLSVEKFREGFSINSNDTRISMPPTIPLVHVIEHGRKD